jgi:general secretion pathway protein J
MLSSVLASDESIRRHEMQLREVQRALHVLESDLIQAGPRPIRDAFGDAQPALRGESQPAVLELSRLGWRNPLQRPRADWQRVSWQLEGDSLQRRYWSVLDQSVDSSPQVQRVLGNVQSWEVRYLDSQGNWLNQWPPEASEESKSSTLLRMPRAVEIRLQHARYGLLTRLLRLPDTPKPKPAYDGDTPPEEAP